MHAMYRSKNRPKNKTAGRFFSSLMYPLAFAAPIMTLPQLNEIWVHKQTAGVSILSWGSFAIISGIWFVYGLIHKERPLMITNFLLMVLQLTITFGVLLFRNG